MALMIFLEVTYDIDQCRIPGLMHSLCKMSLCVLKFKKNRLILFSNIKFIKKKEAQKAICYKLKL